MAPSTPFFNLLDQIIENQPVQWQEYIPIHLSQKTMRIIMNDDGQPSSGRFPTLAWMPCGQWNDLTSISFWLLYFLLPKEAKSPIPLFEQWGFHAFAHFCSSEQ
jgi:hypothetical protein